MWDLHRNHSNPHEHYGQKWALTMNLVGFLWSYITLDWPKWSVCSYTHSTLSNEKNGCLFFKLFIEKEVVGTVNNSNYKFKFKLFFLPLLSFKIKENEYHGWDFSNICRVSWICKLFIFQLEWIQKPNSIEWPKDSITTTALPNSQWKQYFENELNVLKWSNILSWWNAFKTNLVSFRMS